MFKFHTDNQINEKPDTITMYYKYNDICEMKFLFDIADDLNSRNNYYGGVQNFRMCDINGININTMISYFGIETKATNYQNIPYTPNIVHRKITLRDNYDSIESINYNFICAYACYNNGGNGSGKINLPYVTFYVSCASGIFEGYKTVTIYFDNINNTRMIKINK